jgi:hypothetical protein
MNGLFNMNTFVTFALARNALPQASTNTHLTLGLAGGQSKNLLGPVLLQVAAIGPLASLTQENTDLKAANSTLRAELADCQAKLADCQAKLAACQKDLATCQQRSV